MTLNLGRPAGHTVVLTTTARWGQSGVSPIDNLTTWAQTVAAASGVMPTEVIMDPLAAAFLLKDPVLLANFAIFHQPNRNLDLLGQLAVPDEVQYLGSIKGFNFYQYQSTYLNANGTLGKIMPDYTVILGSPSGAEGVRSYGAILDKTIRAASRFPKEWEEEDPAAHFLMTQSAPLPVLGRPDATFCATVN